METVYGDDDDYSTYKQKHVLSVKKYYWKMQFGCLGNVILEPVVVLGVPFYNNYS